jgi:PIN domain nuclease of toxin-antitoxin system
VRLLLDTHVILWNLEGGQGLGTEAREAIEDAEMLFVSAVSFSEIGVKVAIGTLTVPDDLVEQVFRAGVRFLGLSPEHGMGVARLPLHHRDPFDRLLISQAQAEGLGMVTADERIMRYDIVSVPALS